MNALALVLVIAALHPAPGSHATGTASLRLVAGGTRAQIRLSGLMPKASARAILQAGTCTKSGASFALVARLRADASGKANATGAVLFHGSVEVPLRTIADGAHVIRVLAGDRVLACGTIPRR